MIDVAEIPASVDRFATRARTPPPNLDALSRDILALKKKLNAVILAHKHITFGYSNKLSARPFTPSWREGFETDC